MDDIAVDAIAKRIEEIGEVAKRIMPENLATMPEVDWRAVKGIREIIAHDYDEIDVELLASIVRGDLPALHEATSRALAGSEATDLLDTIPGSHENALEGRIDPALLPPIDEPVTHVSDRMKGLKLD